MLYDAQRWDHHPQTHTATPSLPGLISWLETQDLATRYVWATSCTRCLLGRYMAAQGYDEQQIRREYMHLASETRSLAFYHPQTYGAALKRARALTADPDAPLHWHRV